MTNINGCFQLLAYWSFLCLEIPFSLGFGETTLLRSSSYFSRLFFSDFMAAPFPLPVVQMLGDLPGSRLSFHSSFCMIFLGRFNYLTCLNDSQICIYHPDISLEFYHCISNHLLEILLSRCYKSLALNTPQTEFPFVSLSQSCACTHIQSWPNPLRNGNITHHYKGQWRQPHSFYNTYLIPSTLEATGPILLAVTLEGRFQGGPKALICMPTQT